MKQGWGTEHSKQVITCTVSVAAVRMSKVLEEGLCAWVTAGRGHCGVGQRHALKPKDEGPHNSCLDAGIILHEMF